MSHFPTITIEQYVGKCKGVLVTQPLDWVLAHTTRGVLRVGMVGHPEGSTLRFIRILDDETKQTIRNRVAELRKANGQNGISPHTSSVPNPRLIKAYLRGERFRKRPTVIQTPGGVPTGRKKNNERKRIYIPGSD